MVFEPAYDASFQAEIVLSKCKHDVGDLSLPQLQNFCGVVFTNLPGLGDYGMVGLIAFLMRAGPIMPELKSKLEAVYKKNTGVFFAHSTRLVRTFSIKFNKGQGFMHQNQMIFWSEQLGYPDITIFKLQLNEALTFIERSAISGEE